MKANELMIGDWVLNKEGKAERVTQLYDGYVCTETHSDSHDYNFDPIPITPEILEKNGFRDIPDHTLKGAETYCLTMGEYCEIKITYKLGDYFAYDYYDDRWYRQFETSLCYRWCVHNLQHALRLCGIEKEITI